MKIVHFCLNQFFSCQGHLPVFETTEELTAVNSLINEGPKWVQTTDILIGAYSEGGLNNEH